MEILPILWVLESSVKMTSLGNYIETGCLSSLEESLSDLTFAVGWHTCN